MSILPVDYQLQHYIFCILNPYVLKWISRKTELETTYDFNPEYATCRWNQRDLTYLRRKCRQELLCELNAPN